MTEIDPLIPDTLAGSTICVTGSTGYVGSHLVGALIANGYRPVLIGRPDGPQPVVDGAIRLDAWHDPQDLSEQLSPLKNPVLLNIAGHFVGQHNSADISSLIAGNLRYPVEIFEAMALSGHSRIVNLGTSWEYSDSGKSEPVNLYAVLKAANAEALRFYARQHGLRGINLKLNDTFGGNDTRKKLMSILKSNWRAGQPTKLRSPHQELNFLHITDVIEGLLAAACETERLQLGQVKEAFILAKETLTLERLIRDFIARIAPTIEVTFEHPVNTNAQLRSVWTDAPRLPNWTPRISTLQGLANYFEDGT